MVAGEESLDSLLQTHNWLQGDGCAQGVLKYNIYLISPDVLMCRGLNKSRVQTERPEQVAPIQARPMLCYCQRRMVIKKQRGKMGHQTSGLGNLVLPSGGDGGGTGGGPQLHDYTDFEPPVKTISIKHAVNELIQVAVTLFWSHW